MALRDDLPRFDRMADISEYHLPARYALPVPRESARRRAWTASGSGNSVFPSRQIPGMSSPTSRTEARVGDSAPRTISGSPAALIAGATTFVTINSAPNIIAAGVRASYYRYMKRVSVARAITIHLGRSFCISQRRCTL